MFKPGQLLQTRSFESIMVCEVEPVYHSPIGDVLYIGPDELMLAIECSKANSILWIILYNEKLICVNCYEVESV